MSRPCDAAHVAESALAPSTEAARPCTSAVLPAASESALSSCLQTESPAAAPAAARACGSSKGNSAAGLGAAPPRLLQCALRFVRRLAKGAARCLPFSCSAEQLPLLLQAVQQRILADSSAPLHSIQCDAQPAAAVAAAGATSSSCASSSAPDAAPFAPALCAEDEQLVRSLLTQLQHWPDTMQQLWTAMGARKLTEEQVSGACSTHTRAKDMCPYACSP